MLFLWKESNSRNLPQGARLAFIRQEAVLFSDPSFAHQSTSKIEWTEYKFHDSLWTKERTDLKEHADDLFAVIQQSSEMSPLGISDSYIGNWLNISMEVFASPALEDGHMDSVKNNKIALEQSCLTDGRTLWGVISQKGFPPISFSICRVY